MTRVAIIGGGIGGLTAANALSRAGIEAAVYEAAAELREIGAGVALHPNAMKVLRAIGVEDGVRAVAGRSQWQVMRNWKTGRVIGRTSRAAAGGLVRHHGRDRAPGRSPRRAGRRAAGRPGDAGQAMHRGPAGRRRRGRALRRRQRDRGRRHRGRRRHPLTGARLPVRPGRPPVHREDLLSQRRPGRSRPRRAAPRRTAPSGPAAKAPSGWARTARSCCTRCGARN